MRHDAQDGSLPAQPGRPLGLVQRHGHGRGAEGGERVPLPEHVEPDEAGDVVGPGTRRHLRGLALLGDPALVEDQHPGGEREGVQGVVGDQQRDAVVRREVPGQLEPQRRGDPDVEAGEGLVEQQQRGLGGQRARDRDPLRLPARQLAGAAAGEAAHAEPVQPGPRGGRGLLRGRHPGCAARRRRCRARTGGGTAPAPGTPGRSAGRGRAPAGRSTRCRPPRPDRPGRRSRPARAAGWSCRRRWDRSPPRRPPAPRRRTR